MQRGDKGSPLTKCAGHTALTQQGQAAAAVAKSSRLRVAKSRRCFALESLDPRVSDGSDVAGW